MIQVGAEAPCAYQLFQVAVGGGHHADIHADLFAAAQPVVREAVQGPQQLGLDLEIEIANLVQKECSFVGEFEKAGLHGIGTAERAFLVTEKLALYQMLRNGGAVHVYPWMLAALRVIVDDARNHLFSRAGFARNQHGSRLARQFFRQLHQSLQRFAADNDAALVECGLTRC